MPLRELMQHQEEAVQYALRQRHPAFFMEMRLGKTLATIRWIQRVQPFVTNVLVVAPLTVLEAWEKELSLEGEEYRMIHGLKKDNKINTFAEIFSASDKRLWGLLNYETLLSLPIVSTLDWGAVVLDESTRIRNPKTKTGSICLKGFRTASHRAVLSGLPSPESELDFYQQMAFLDGQFMGQKNYWHFRQEHFEPDTWGFGWAIKKGRRELIKKAVHSRAFVRRRTDVSLGSKKIYETRTVGMTKQQEKLYTQVEDEFATTLSSGVEVETQYAIVKQTWLCRLAGGFTADAEMVSTTKVDALVELLTGELSSDSVVVWFRFNAEIEAVARTLNDVGVTHTVVVGGEDRESRKDKINDFRIGKQRVMLAQVKCAKYGIDISTCSTAIYFSNVWSCEDRVQSEDRILHPKKKEPLLYIDLVTKGSVDEEVVSALQNKSFNSKYMMTYIHKGIMSRGGYT